MAYKDPNDPRARERGRRYRDKDVAAYQARKAAYAKTPAQREKARLWQARYREAHREEYNRRSREASQRLKQDPEARQRIALNLRNNYLLRTYGITLADYDALMERQDGRCAICGRTAAEAGPRHPYLAVDHNHVTGVIRGLLCFACNTRMGWVEDNAEALRAYLIGQIPSGAVW